VVLLACGNATPSTTARTPSATATATASASAPASTTTPASALITAALASHRAHDIAESLADEVGPRLAGSPGDPAAVAWAERTMRDLGLANVHTEPVTVPVWRRGVETAEITEPSRQSLAVTALGWSGATPKEGVLAEVVEVESLAALEAMPKDSAKGKIIFANVVMPRTDDGRGYGMTVGVRLQGPRAAMNAGAAAFVVRSLGTASDRFPHAGSSLLKDVPNPIAAAAVSTVDADLLHRTLARGKPVKMLLVLTPERAKDAASANVVGEVAGTTKKDEVVLLGAHLDSWDLGRGAIDDGAGCGIVLEAARLVATQKHARSVRVVLFAAEENSIAGAKAYFAAHGADAARFVLAMEADSGTDRARLVRFAGDPARAGAFAEIARALAPLGITQGEGDARGGTDVSPLVGAGVPTIEVRQDASRYFDIHHTANDTSDKLDATALAQVSAAFAEIASRAADLESDFGRVPESKRKSE
jgi:Zn-dependent M28 family amino/carboxypeptidase